RVEGRAGRLRGGPPARAPRGAAVAGAGEAGARASRGPPDRRLGARGCGALGAHVAGVQAQGGALTLDVVDLTRRLVAAPSPNPPGDERAAAAVLSEYLDGLPGVKREALGSDDRRPNVVFAAGEGQPVLALSAHLDTHRVTPGWSRDPFSAATEGERIYGLGTTGNKG